jgi:hypothetical protein
VVFVAQLAGCEVVRAAKGSSRIGVQKTISLSNQLSSICAGM